MRERDHGLDPRLEESVEHVVVEREPGLVGLLLVALREDAAPRYRGAEALEPHLGEQLDVVAVGVVEVDAVVVGVALPLDDPVRDASWDAMGARGHDVRDREALAPLAIPALELMRRHGASPQEVLRK